MLNHCSKGNRHNGNDRTCKELPVLCAQNSKRCCLFCYRKTYPGCLFYCGEVAQSAECGNNIGTQKSKQNRDNSNHSLAPDVADHNYCNGKNCYPPVCLGAAYGRTGEDESYAYNYWTCYHWRKESHYPLCAKGCNESCKHKIEKAGASNANAGIWQRL